MSVIGLVNNVRAVGASDGVVAVTVVGVVVGDGAPAPLQVTVKFWVTLPVPPDGAFTVIVLGLLCTAC